MSIRAEVSELLAHREGHFRFESGHHGSPWLDLERLCLDPAKVESLAGALAEKLAPYISGSECAHPDRPPLICGPLVEGAFVALAVARRLGVRFTYSTPTERARLEGSTGDLYPVEYPIPAPLHSVLRGGRVIVVNDVINAGSAVRGTLASLRALGAEPVAIGTLATLGGLPQKLAGAEGLPLLSLAAFEVEIYEPADCRWCAAGVPLDE